MLPQQIKTIINRVNESKENLAVKIETPDLVYTTDQIINIFFAENRVEEKPFFFIVAENWHSEFKWNEVRWINPKSMNVVDFFEVIEQGRDEFCIYIFWDIGETLENPPLTNQPNLRTLLPRFFLSSTARRKLLIFLEPLGTQYPSILTPYVIPLVESYPSREELVPMIRRELLLAKQNISEDLLKQLAYSLLGLTYTGAKNMLKITIDKFAHLPEGEEFEKTVINDIHRQKEEILAQTLGMSILKPSSDDIPFGMEYLMRDLEVHKSKICVEGQDREKGWLLIGTPGSGKSLISKYIAYTMGFPAISFNISSIMNSLVGQTEKNMHAFCQVVEAFAPVVLYIDEFDKALSSGQELDGGTMTRALGILFSWLNDTNAPVFLLASANNLDPNMGFALTRRGRFSQLYWVGEPCRKARYQILQFAFRKRNFDVEERLIEELADKTLYFSGADLVWLVNESIAFANYYNDDPFSFRNRVLALVEENRPRVLIMKKRYDTLREWAEAYCRPAGPKPEE